MDTEPEDLLWRAVCQGDESCPDGRSLANLGRLVRQAARPPRPIDLTAQVRARCAALADQDGEATLIDEVFQEGNGLSAAAAPDLVRLRDTIRQVSRPPNQVDLLPRLEGRLAEINADQQAWNQRQTSSGSWRVYSLIVAGHVAALLALAIFHLRTVAPTTTDKTGFTADPVPVRTSAAVAAALAKVAPSGLSTDWRTMAANQTHLSGLRKETLLRTWARQRYGTEGSSGTVAAAVSWLALTPVVTSQAIGPQAQAERAAIALALLGEGGQSPELPALIDRLAKDPLVAEGPHATVAADMVALALVEATQLLPDSNLWNITEAALKRCGERQHSADAWAGQTGFLLLAVAQAEYIGLALPANLTVLIDQTAQTNSQTIQAPGRLALILFARRIRGLSVGDLPDRVFAGLPSSGRPANASLDLIDAFFVSTALRETPGKFWDAWIDDLQRRIIANTRYGLDNSAAFPGECLAHRAWANSDAFATALAVLNLQSAYRFVPLVPPTH